ncbi:NXPE family member 4-like, partial [Saccoglossus kowalevskii]|uniref:NXPE family member 4-like n=1 Tax=Saccoglossus kowalevskii TaxID=10224 RepID=A0ABM0N1E0_SACKO
LRLVSGNHSDIKQGEIVHVTIETYDSRNMRKNVGGDFFFAVMSNGGNVSTAGRVADHMNGTYSVHFYAGWNGSASIHVILVHPREAVHWLKTSFLPRERRIEWTGIFSNVTTNETSVCYVSGSTGSAEDVCEFGNRNSLGNTVFVCEKADSLPCETLTYTRVKKSSLSDAAEKIVSEYEVDYLFKGPHIMTKLAGSPLKLEIQGRHDSNFDNLQPCIAELPIPISDGFWIDGETWQSLVCRARHFTLQQALECLRGKSVYLLGDSTVRMWQNFFRVNMTRTMSAAGAHRLLTSDEYNVSILFEFPAIRIGSVWSEFKNDKYESDVLDSLQSCNIIVTLSLTYHFESWTNRSYMERLHHVHSAVQRLMSRCPGAIVIIKSSHPREHTTRYSHVHSSDWTLFQMNTITRKMFSGMGVSFLDVYDMSLSHYSVNDVHMHIPARQQIDLFLSFVCP